MSIATIEENRWASQSTEKQQTEVKDTQNNTNQLIQGDQYNIG